ncbi:MAG TPA: hypothetical protein VK627_03400 [Edaphobacter sp.]|nr:hypothetical protein [Edaphobacter sp.]
MKLKNAVLLGVVAGAITLPLVPTLVAQGPPPPGYSGGYGQEPWASPPGEYQDIQRRGFHDGIEGARKDFENHRRPNVNNRDEFRHPENVPGHDRRAYKDAFRRGYDMGVQHIMNGGRR